jgi:hypothetical protein
MKLRSITLCFAFAVASVAAHAQSAIYAAFDAQEFTRTGIQATAPAGSSNSDSPWLYGPVFGVYYTPAQLHIPLLGKVKTGPVKIGFDARGDILRTNTQYSRDDAIISLRVTPSSPLFGVRLYAQGGAGIGHTKVPGQLNYANNWSYQMAIGADKKLKGRIDWRIVEAGAGFLGSYKAGLGANDNNYMITLGTGFAVRLGGK